MLECALIGSRLFASFFDFVGKMIRSTVQYCSVCTSTPSPSGIYFTAGPFATKTRKKKEGKNEKTSRLRWLFLVSRRHPITENQMGITSGREPLALATMRGTYDSHKEALHISNRTGFQQTSQYYLSGVCW